MRIEMGKQYQYRSGTRALRRILAIDCLGNKPVLSETDNGILIGHRADGTTGMITPNDYDLIPVPERFERTAWVNVYDDRLSICYGSRLAASNNAACGRIACVQITVAGNVGDGL